jgi:AcrR family transcriptional regulator
VRRRILGVTAKSSGRAERTKPRTQPGVARRGARAPAGPPDPTLLAAGELRKSGDTRRRIMDAAVHCLANYGYAGVNAVTVAEQAGLTRPAMLYHFPTRISLIEAAINYVVLQRIARFEAALADAVHLPQRARRSIEQAWEENHTPLYRAYCELANAARTDPDLEAVFAPAMRAYDRARRESAARLFPPEVQAQPGYHLRRDVTRFLLDGMAEHGWMIEDEPRRRARLLAFLKVLADAPEAQTLLRKAIALADAHEA